MSDAIETRAGTPGRFEFGGRTYRVAPASAAQHFELVGILKRHAPNPVAEAARLLKEIGDGLSQDERLLILREAQEQARPRYVTKVRVAWDTESNEPASSLGLSDAELAAVGVAPGAAIGAASLAAWRRGLRPDSERTKSETTAAERKLRDALNEHFASESREVTEQVGGWPPAIGSSEAAAILYSGPGLPDVLAAMLPPHNHGMTREDAEAIGRAMLDEADGAGIRAFLGAFDGDDKSGDPA